MQIQGMAHPPPLPPGMVVAKKCLYTITDFLLVTMPLWVQNPNSHPKYDLPHSLQKKKVMFFLSNSL
jgi:hypothetical protein